jgi:hypothetical protein
MGEAQLFCAKPGVGVSARVPSTLPNLVVRAIDPDDPNL